MEPLVVVIAAALVGVVAGFLLGRGWGRSAGLESGRAAGLHEGKKAGIAEGTRAGMEEGRRSGREEGRSEGRAAGFEEGRSAGLEEGRAAGVIEGRRSGFTDGREAGLREGRSEYRQALASLVEAVKRGRAPSDVDPDSAEGELYAALRQGWAPREVEREAAMREAVSRVSAYLGRTVREPLAGASEESEAPELQERIERALGALQDLDFFIEEIEEHREGADLVRIAQAVSRDFAADHEVGVRLLLGVPTVHAQVNSSALLDALYLVLHNAARFGGGGTVDLSVGEHGGRATLTVRDRGAGFSEEAFARAFDPFYSTSDEGLGLGLPHARKVIEAMGGQIELRNVPDGGAEVELSFSAT
jgi:signal transduction histidine kinase